MGATDLPTAAQMIDIDNALRFLLVAFFTGAAGVIGTIVLAAKWYIPRRLRQQTAERQVQLNALKKELETKHAADAVEIERDRMLPQMVENNQRLVDAMIKSKDADTAATLQRIELDKTTAAVLLANTHQVTTHSDRLDENTDRLEAVEKQLGKLYNKVMVAFPHEVNIEEILNELRGAMQEIKKACSEKKKGDSQPLPSVTLPVDKGTILITGIEPDDLNGKETDLPKAG